jgi:tetratricopeptide (TPR) repeat protein
VTGSCKNHTLRRWTSLRTQLLCGLLCLSSVLAYAATARKALQRAATLVEQGHLEEAAQQAQLALADPETRASAYSVLGTIRLQQNRIPESVSFLQQAIRLEPRLVGARLSLAAALAAQGEHPAAVDMYHRVLELDRSNSVARIALARYESDKGNARQSLELVRPILQELKKSPDGLLLLASDYLKLSDRAAGDLVKDWTRLPDVPAEWSIKFALLLGSGGLTNEAIDVLESARKSGQSSYELDFNLAGLYLLNGNPTLALQQYDAALAAKPDSAPALRQAAMIAEREGHLERSLSYWTRAKKLEPENPEALSGFGRVCLKMDLLEDAEPALTKAVGLKPDDLNYQYLLGSTKVGKKQFDAAQSIFEKLVEKRPQDSQLQYALGSVFYLEGHLSNAAVHLTESARLQPNQLASYYYLALIARDQGNGPEAIARLEQLIQQYPDHAPSREALGELQMSTQQYPEAEANLERAVQLDPTSVKANYQLGLLLARMGKREEANKHLEIAKSLRKEDEATSRLQLRLLDPYQ